MKTSRSFVLVGVLCGALHYQSANANPCSQAFAKRAAIPDFSVSAIIAQPEQSRGHRSLPDADPTRIATEQLVSQLDPSYTDIVYTLVLAREHNHDIHIKDLGFGETHLHGQVDALYVDEGRLFLESQGRITEVDTKKDIKLKHNTKQLRKIVEVADPALENHLNLAIQSMDLDTPIEVSRMGFSGATIQGHLQSIHMKSGQLYFQINDRDVAIDSGTVSRSLATTSSPDAIMKLVHPEQALNASLLLKSRAYGVEVTARESGFTGQQGQGQVSNVFLIEGVVHFKVGSTTMVLDSSMKIRPSRVDLKSLDVMSELPDPISRMALQLETYRLMEVPVLIRQIGFQNSAFRGMVENIFLKEGDLFATIDGIEVGLMDDSRITAAVATSLDENSIDLIDPRYRPMVEQLAMAEKERFRVKIAEMGFGRSTQTGQVSNLRLNEDGHILFDLDGTSHQIDRNMKIMMFM